ncbi:MAG: DegT/DnrJ/EryC1/StrS family aminotransferase, partial [Candidatus Eiseniibacteriota bacterium]
RLRLALSGIPGIRLIETPSQTHASYLRFPVLVEEAACRAPLIAALRARGIAAGPLYPRPLHRVDELAGHGPDHGGRFPNAERLAECLLTLPTYPHVDDRVVGAVRQAAEAVLGVAPGTAEPREPAR